MRPLDIADLPAEVRFTNWSRYQHTNATQWVKLHYGVIYDGRVGCTDLARSMMLTGLVLAGVGHGKISTRAWLFAHTASYPRNVPVTSAQRTSDVPITSLQRTRNVPGTYYKRLRFQIKDWIDNGLLTPVPVQIDRKIEREIDIPEASPPAPKKRASRAEPKPLDEAPSLALKPTTWLEPYRVVWEAVCGEASFAAVAGQAARFLRPLDKAHGPDKIAAHLARYLADTGPEYRNLSRFAANWGAFGPGQVLVRSTDDKATGALALVKRIVGEHKGWQYMPQSAWSAFDDQTRAGIAAAGGLRAIWESTSESGLARVFTDGYRNGRLNGNGAHAH